MDSIKAKSQLKAPEPATESKSPPWEKATGTPAWEQPAKVTGDVQSAKLKQLLGQIKQS